jgi:hypothetical protein
MVYVRFCDTERMGLVRYSHVNDRFVEVWHFEVVCLFVGFFLPFCEGFP